MEVFTTLRLNLMSSIDQPECFTVVILNDNFYEVDEEFSLNLTTTYPNIILSPNYKIIRIKDDDSESLS